MFDKPIMLLYYIFRSQGDPCMRAVERWDFSFGDIIVFDFGTIVVKRIVKGEVSKR
jgi:hypothetical protein